MSIVPDTTPTPSDWPELQRQRRAIVVVDVVESVRLMQANEADVIDRWRRFVNEVRTQVLPAHGGRLVKSLGDGLLLEFESVQAATRFGLDAHTAVKKYSIGRAAAMELWLRVGVHIADVVVDADDIYGVGVNLAARLAGLAGPGQIIVSPEVRDGLVDGLDADLEDMGECYVKHLEAPIRAFRLCQAKEVERSADALADIAESRPVVAVVPFDFQGDPNDPEGQSIGELIADGVIALLCANPSVRIISRISSTAFRGRDASLESIADKLGASYILSGSYRFNGQKVLGAAELAEAKTGTVVWADRIVVEHADLLQRESELLNFLAAAVTREVSAMQAAATRLQPLPSLTGYTLQLGGVSLMHRSAGPDFARAKDVLEHLTARYPRLAIPRAWLAKWYVLRVTRGLVQDPKAEAGLALDHTRRAIDADPNCSLAMAMQGFVQCHMLRDLDTALASMERAIELNPSDSLAWLFKGVVHSFWGQGSQALDAVGVAQALSPLDPLKYYYDALAAAAALSADRWDLAVETARQSLRGNRMHSQNLRTLVVGLDRLGKVDEARQVARQLLLLEPGLTISSYLARAPAGANPTRVRYAESLARAGVPHS